MSDDLTPKQRSYCMSRIRSKWTAQERRVHNALKGLRVRHKMHPNIQGSPDIIIPEAKTAVFLHGCFWHQHSGCKNAVTPKSNREFWIPKLRRNIQRDRYSIRQLKKSGHRVKVIWECEIRKKKNSKEIQKFLAKRINLQNEN